MSSEAVPARRSGPTLTLGLLTAAHSLLHLQSALLPLVYIAVLEEFHLTERDIGLSSMLMLNTINATVQHSVPNELRGRVMALYVTVLAGVGPLGGLFAGALAQWRGAPAALVVGASIAAVFVVIAAFGYGVLRRPAPLPA